MVKIQEFIKEKHMEKDVITLIQIHDELILEVKSEIIKEVISPFKDIMESAAKLGVPLKADVRIGNKWGEME
ncbi:MAG TPA: DNA polymerase, partial [Candidatus Paceibacterota bacterium]|nr:DNA polymerase [Candidatus Paceibacterota bacterium]